VQQSLQNACANASPECLSQLSQMYEAFCHAKYDFQMDYGFRQNTALR
jgi:hypothetical protein